MAPLELRFDTCTLNYATFRDLDLSGSALEDCLAHEALFSGLQLVKTCFRGTDLTGSTFDACNLSGADFRGVRSYRISVKRNRVEGLEVSLPEALGLLAGLGVDIS